MTAGRRAWQFTAFLPGDAVMLFGVRAATLPEAHDYAGAVTGRARVYGCPVQVAPLTPPPREHLPPPPRLRRQ